mmetsp:Transcript_56164/g.149342  ORF Transcript_56164/g.149342 Transcript_56164/m.149342 type:complete len:84 (+) Transcript_56164:1621-1872(+)
MRAVPMASHRILRREVGFVANLLGSRMPQQAAGWISGRLDLLVQRTLSDCLGGYLNDGRPLMEARRARGAGVDLSSFHTGSSS